MARYQYKSSMFRAMPRKFAPPVPRYGLLVIAVIICYFILRPGRPSFYISKDGPSVYLDLHGSRYRVLASENDLGVSPDAIGYGEPESAVGGAASAAQKLRDQKSQKKVGGAAEAAQNMREEGRQEVVSDEPIVPPKNYKEAPERFAPIEDPFPWLTKHNKAPPVVERNRPPNPHVPEQTPLMIGFTRNWPMLVQCVSSYIAAGWPAEDIYVVENTGTFGANARGELSLQNPFFLNHTQLHILGAKVIETPTLLTFAQLQNYFLHTALQNSWDDFFWSHQDVLVFSDEDAKKRDRDHDHAVDPYATLYQRAVGVLRHMRSPDSPPWATHFFAYDHLTLVHRDAMLKVGAWDTHIPFYSTDCDMYLRLHWAGYWQPSSEVGLILDVNTPLSDVGALFRLPGAHAGFAGDAAWHAAQQQLDQPGAEVEQKKEREMRSWVNKEGESWAHLVQVVERMQKLKYEDEGIFRNVWQTRQSGGRGEPFHRDPAGFEAGIETLIDAGRRLFADKWGHRGCDLVDMGIDMDDMWRLERDWDISEGPGNEGGNWHKDWTGV